MALTGSLVGTLTGALVQSLGGSSTVEVDGIATPTLSITGGNSDVSLLPELNGSAFALTGEASDSHASTDWQISDDAGFSNIVWEELNSASKTQVTVDVALSETTTYYARCRYKGSTYTSEYSATVSFVTSEIVVAAPMITSPSDSATDIGETPTITTSAFSVPGGSDTHAVSDWQIASDSDFNTIVVQSLDDASNLESWTVPATNLSTSTTYYVRARHGGTSEGDSDWSSTVSFTTAASFVADIDTVLSDMVTAGANILYFDAQDLSSMTVGTNGTGGTPGVGDPVGRWTDSTGSVHAVAASASERPILRQDANNNYYLEPDAVDDEMDFSISITGNELYCAAAFTPTSTSYNFERIVSCRGTLADNSATTGIPLVRNGTTDSFGIFVDAIREEQAVTDDVTIVMETGIDGTDAFSNKNGGTDSTSSYSSGARSITTGTFFGRSGLSAGNTACHLYGAVLSDTIPDSDDRSAIRSALATASGVSL